MSPIKPRTTRPRPDYPSRDEAHAPACDSDRRRFLRQLAAGAGAAVVGLPRLSHGQSLTTNFAKLDAHPPVAAGEDGNADALAGGEAVAALEEERADLDDAFGSDDDAEDLLVEAEPIEVVTESRALWIEPGYLILLRWRRAASDESVVAALEGSADAVGMFLSERVEGVDDLHNIERLHPIEAELVQFLQPRVATAMIEVVHLDHDCTAVCSALNPSRTYPEIYEIDGEMPSPGWE